MKHFVSKNIKYQLKNKNSSKMHYIVKGTKICTIVEDKISYIN